MFHTRYLILLTSLLSGIAVANDPTTSICFGSTDKGELEHGWQLPREGKNFTAYSLLGASMGRTYVHSKVHSIILTAYKALETQAPDKRFVYGETGWERGGKFRPHKTHQNGLSVDFFVPVRNGQGESVPLPTSVLNKWGYNIEFTGPGVYEEYRIDYEAMAAHLLALKQAADQQGTKIWRVIFDNDLQRELFKTPQGQTLQNQLTFSNKKPWVRHDEHYHVDFAPPCQPLTAKSAL